MHESIFQFAENIPYMIVVEGGIQLDGMVTHCLTDGIVMEDGTHIPQDKILFFKPAGQPTQL